MILLCYVLIVLLLLLLIYVFWNTECFWQGPSFYMLANGSPVEYRKPIGGNIISIRRWRNPVPDQSNILGPPRQLTEDIWDRTYRSGIGFQLG
jgi:hypothetical protein